MSAVAALPEALLPVYTRPDVRFVRGQGAYLFDDQARAYLDLTAGIGVNALGHGSPVVARALEQALTSGLVHTSNLFRTEPAESLARALTERAFPSRAFFVNSGAESVEAALKFARRWAREQGGPAKHRVLAFRRSFHGRLFGSLAVTDRPGYREPFAPLMPGVDFADVGGVDAVDRLISARETAAVIIEPVQGEGGVHVVPPAFLETLRELCTRRRVALVFDEVQCGLGRTGTLFAYQQSGVAPDLLTLAKPLAGGLPMGAVLVGDPVAEAVRPGDHATTFGGGPLVATVARAVLETVARPAFLDGVAERAVLVEAWARSLEGRADVVAVRGVGLMWGVELTGPAAPVVERARDLGVLAVSAGPNVLRVLPPLNIGIGDLTDGLGRLVQALG